MGAGSDSALQYSALRYVEASRITRPAGGGSRMDVRDTHDQKIGSVDGLLIDPVEHRLRFFVVKCPTWFGSRRRLLPLDRPAQVGHGGNSVRMELHAADLAACEEFESSLVQPYSDDDRPDATFTQRIA